MLWVSLEKQNWSICASITLCRSHRTLIGVTLTTTELDAGKLQFFQLHLSDRAQKKDKVARFKQRRWQVPLLAFFFLRCVVSCALSPESDHVVFSFLFQVLTNVQYSFQSVDLSSGMWQQSVQRSIDMLQTDPFFAMDEDEWSGLSTSEWGRTRPQRVDDVVNLAYSTFGQLESEEERDGRILWEGCCSWVGPIGSKMIRNSSPTKWTDLTFHVNGIFHSRWRYGRRWSRLRPKSLPSSVVVYSKELLSSFEKNDFSSVHRTVCARQNMLY